MTPKPEQKQKYALRPDTMPLTRLVSKANISLRVQQTLTIRQNFAIAGRTKGTFPQVIPTSRDRYRGRFIHNTLCFCGIHTCTGVTFRPSPCYTHATWSASRGCSSVRLGNQSTAPLAWHPRTGEGGILREYSSSSILVRMPVHCLQVICSMCGGLTLRTRMSYNGSRPRDDVKKGKVVWSM